MSGMPFATYNSNTNSFNRYINDRRPYLYGVIGDTSKKEIKWCTFVCKITDGDGNLLYKDTSGTPAVYEELGQDNKTNTFLSASHALNVAGTPALYDAEGALYEENVYQIQMLVPSYDLISGRQIKLNENGNGRKVTLTTASVVPDEMGFKYTGDERFAATIVRTANTSTMIYLYNNNSYELTLRNITLDGGGFAATDGGGIVLVKGENAVILDEGATLKNNHATNKDGGAVYLNDTGSQLTMNKGSVITDCTAGTSSGGGVYMRYGTFYMNGGEITNCSAANGGGVYLNNSAKLYMNGESKNGAVITGNKATTAGGGIQLQHKDARAYFSGYCTVLGNTIGEGTRCNVQLQADSNFVINTDTEGLDSRSEIGIYTPDGNVTNKHGVSAMPFGTRQQDNDKFYCFVNDRNVILRGVRGTDTDTLIYWEGRPLLRVGKTVASDLTADSAQEFSFTVQLTLTDALKGEYFKALHNTYGDMDFDQSGKATLTLKNGEASTASFPFDFFENEVVYTVTETVPAASYTTSVWNMKGDTVVERNSTSGKLGENIIAESNDSTSLSDVVFTNTRVTGSLTVSKQVISDKDSDYDTEFSFKLTLDDNSITKEYDTTHKDKFGTETPGKLNVSEGVASFTLMASESLAIRALPTDLKYTVEEDIPADLKNNIRTQVKKDKDDEIYAQTQTGKIGETSTTETVEGVEKTVYASEVTFINNFLKIVCKITNRSRDLLYYRDSSGKLQPAIFSHLEDAFDQINSGNLRTSGNGTVSGQLRIEMVVPAYTMERSAALDSGKNVVLSTALPEDRDYPYNGGEDDGNGNISVVTRGFADGSMIVDRGTLTIDRITLDGGAEADEPIEATADGGIVKVDSNVSLTVNSGATLRNSAVTGGSDEESKVSGNGGAIYLTGGASLNMYGTIENCSAQVGGGVYADTGFVTITTTGIISGCEAVVGSGGAIYASNGGSVRINAGSSMKGNKAADNGGAIYSETNLILRGTIGGTENGESNTAGNGGGGIYIGNDTTFTMYGGSEISGNRALQGGGLYAQGETRIAGGSLESNSAVSADDDHPGMGGALYAAETAAVTISGTPAISRNEAAQGGAVYGAGSVTLSGGSMTNNVATAKGGAVYVADEKTFTMSGGSINGNKSPEGAVSTGSGAELMFSGNSVVYGNMNADETAPMNVYLGYDSNSIIKTSGLGSGTSTKIGVYVADGEPEDPEEVEDAVDNPIYCEHGVAARNFGTYTGSSVSSARLNKFINDRDTSLYGMDGGENDDNRFIAWIGKGLQIMVSKIEYVETEASEGDSEETAATEAISGVSFTLTNSDGIQVWSGKSDSNGLVKISWGAEETANGNVAQFAAKSSYTLEEIASSKDAVRPAGKWTLTVGRDNSVTWDYVASAEDTNQTIAIDLPADSGSKAYLGDTFDLYNDVKPTLTFDVNDGESAVSAKLSDNTQKKTEIIAFTTTETSHNYKITETNPSWDSHVFKSWATLEEKPTGENDVELSKEELAEYGYFEYSRDDVILFYRGTESASNGQGKAKGDLTLYAQWDEVVCKVTDRNGNLLYLNGAPAVYSRLEDCFEDYNILSFTYQNGSRATARRIEMLVEEYTLEEPVKVARGKIITLTTAPATDTDGYAYTGAEGSVSTITRGENCGGSMITNTSNLTLMNITLDGGGRSVTTDGGIVNNDQSSAILTIASGATLQNSFVDGNGGAINANIGTTVEILGGTINNNICSGSGAGIYLTKGSILKLSGNPNFGGNDLKGGDGTDKDDIVGTNGNFSTVALPANSTNGTKPYTKARQDIFIAGYFGEPATSLVVTGEITSGEGSIWVWAEQVGDEVNHYKQLMQFGVMTDAVKGLNEDKLASTLKAFRNAQPDETTENGTDTYLYGTKEGETEGYIYWSGVSGSRKVILRKVAAPEGNNGYSSLSNARFTIYKGNSVLESNLTSSANGVFWIGELNYGIYLLEEVQAPAGYSSGQWFYLIVDEKGTPVSEQSYGSATEAAQAAAAEAESRKNA